MKLLPLFFFFVSCAFSTTSPSSRFVTSESSGKLWGGNASISRAGATVSTMHVTSTQVKPDLEIEAAGEVGANASLGLAEKVDVTLNTGFNSMTTLGAKYQLWGDSRLKAKKGSMSWSVAGFYGRDEDKNADDDLLDLNGNTKVDLNRSVAEIQTIFGRRLMDSILAYANLSFASYQMDGSVRSDRTAINGATFKYNGDVTSSGLGFAYYEKKLVVQFELALQRAKWDNSITHTYGLLNASVGFIF